MPQRCFHKFMHECAEVSCGLWGGLKARPMQVDSGEILGDARRGRRGACSFHGDLPSAQHVLGMPRR